MFGYIVADIASLTEEQKTRYRGCYCGLCRMIGTEFGTMQRLTLNYDLTFLALLLSSLYEPLEKSASAHCLVHPFSPHPFWHTEATAYAAAMNIALTYHKCLDNWEDDKNPASYLFAAALNKSIKQISNKYPRQWLSIQSCMTELSKLETENCQDPDMGANTFGRLMGELFVWKEDRWAQTLRSMGEALGRFIYLTDALLDLPDDIIKGRYNPLCSRADSNNIQSDFRPILTIMIGECCDAFERLPLTQDLDLLRNILYSGVWTRYQKHISKEQDHD